MSTVKDYIGFLKAYKKNVLEVRELAEISALTELNSVMKQRIFSNSTGTEGRTFGTYRSEAYKKKRSDNGRQTTIKDLQFSGAFKLSMVVGKNQGRNVLGFNNDKSADIREGQEKGSKTRYGVDVKQIGFDIFVPTNDEIDQAFAKYVEVIDNKINSNV